MKPRIFTLALAAFSSLVGCMKADTPPPSLPASLIGTARQNRVPALGGACPFSVGEHSFVVWRDAAKNVIQKDNAQKEIAFEGKARTESELLMFTSEGWKSVTTQAQIDQAIAAKSLVFVMFTPTEFIIFNLPTQESYFFPRSPVQQ